MGRSVIYLLRKRHYTAIEAQLDPRDRTPNARAILEKMASVLPTSKPSRVNVMSWWTHVQLGGPKDTQLEYELTYPTNWIYVYVAMEENDGNTVLTSFRIKQLNESLEQINAFTLAHKSPAQYLLLVTLVGIGAFVFWTLVEAANARWMRWPIRIVWCLVICIGAGEISMNWTAGEIGVKVLTLRPRCRSGNREYLCAVVCGSVISIRSGEFLVEEGRGLASLGRPGNGSA